MPAELEKAIIESFGSVDKFKTSSQQQALVSSALAGHGWLKTLTAA